MSKMTWSPLQKKLPQGQILSFNEGELMAGDFVALMGKNGTGKTSLLRLLVGLDVPHQGEIRINDQSLSGLSVTKRSRLISFLPQKYEPHFYMTVRDFVTLGRFTKEKEDSAQEFCQDVREILTTFHLLHKDSHDICSLSGGEMQRALLAQAVYAQAEFLFLDEPFNHLDDDESENLATILKDLSAQKMAIMASLHQKIWLDKGFTRTINLS